MPIHCHTWAYITCLEIPAENCQWKGTSFYPITDLYFNWEPTNITKINKYNKKTEQYFYNEDKYKQVHSQIKVHNEHLKNITKIGKYKKLNYKVSKNKHTTNEDKNNQIHSQIKIHKEYLKNINKIEKYKKLNMTEHKTHENY